MFSLLDLKTTKKLFKDQTSAKAHRKGLFGSGLDNQLIFYSTKLRQLSIKDIIMKTIWHETGYCHLTVGDTPKQLN